MPSSHLGPTGKQSAMYVYGLPLDICFSVVLCVENRLYVHGYS